MSNGKKPDDEGMSLPPVEVNEAIPLGGEHDLSPEMMLQEGVPSPENLRIHHELGRGGMGRIHPATDRKLLRRVALKRLDKQMSTVPMYRDGFVAEAQMTGQLEHPNIVPVHELDVSPEGIPYFTMKLIKGVGFDKWLWSKDYPVGSSERLEEGLEIFLKVCDAMAYAHAAGVIHRDLKPENIMVGRFGQVYLMDWGLARLSRTRAASGSRSQMEAHGAVGTPAYMAPEQARGNPADMDERTDIFGMGSVLYEIICGKTPYGAIADGNQVVEMAKQGRIVSIDEACKGIGVSRRIRNIVSKAIAENPADRYQSVLELQKAVRKFLSGGLHLPRKLFKPGEVIVREGDGGDTAFMVVAGTCRAYRTDNGQQETLGTMGPGDVFGEMALILDEPRAATVEAVDRLTVLILDKATMDEGLGIDGWTGALVRALAQRFRALETRVRASGMPRG